MVDAAVAAVDFVTARAESQRTDATTRLEMSLGDRLQPRDFQELPMAFAAIVG